jgi:hypothetical protein
VSSAVDTVSGAASSAYDAASAMCDAYGNVKQVILDWLKGKIDEVLAVIAEMGAQVITLARMIVPKAKFDELNLAIGVLNTLGLVSLPSIAPTQAGAAELSEVSPAALNGLLAGLQSAVLTLYSYASSSPCSSPAESAPVQRMPEVDPGTAQMIKDGIIVAAIQGARVATIVTPATTALGGAAAPATEGASAPVGLQIGLILDAVAVLLAFAVYAATHSDWSRDDDGDDPCRSCPPFTSATYGPLDHLGRATGARATLRGRDFGGSKPMEDPAGFESGVSGKFGGQHRAHLLARTLGGSGESPNLVTFGGPENIKMYHDAESEVETHVTLNGNNCVEFSSTPVYEGDSLSPTGIRLVAEDKCNGWKFERLISNRTLH